MNKSLIVCCDGTWNTAEQKGGPTNVTKMARAICPSDKEGRPQSVYYDEGIGTGNVVDRWIGGGLGLGLFKNVQQAYRWLCLNYEPGDRLLLFGFSRGAYTVRSLAGLVSLAGLLRKGDLDKLPAVWDWYRAGDKRPPLAELEAGLRQREAKMEAKQAGSTLDPASAAKPMFRHEPVIDFIGVWDTVGALGIPGGPLKSLGRRHYNFHNLNLGSKVRRAFQALAIDERRSSFGPAIWNGGAADGQSVEQKWFAGAHSNVGGGYEDRVLSDVAFLWMCDKVGDLLTLDRDYLDNRERVVPYEAGKPAGRIEDTFRGKWRLLGGKDREIGRNATEDVHDSARERLLATAEKMFEPFPYLPINLIGYLEQKGVLRPGAREWARRHKRPIGLYPGG